MVNHTKKFCIKQKEKEIQKKLRQEEKRLLKESAYKRELKKRKEKHKKNLEYQKEYQKKYRLKKAKDREEKVIALLGKRNWLKIKVEGRKSSYYVVDDGHIYNKSGKEVGNVYQNGYAQTSFGFIHRIIWEAFKGKIPEGYEIDHINTVRNDNRLENLRLVTSKENSNNPLTIEHYKTVDRTYLTKYYDIIQMDSENNVIAKYKTTKDIPSKYDKSSIYGAINGKYKTAYGYIWKAKYIKNIC